MLISKDQFKSFWRLWAQACRANGWTARNGMSQAEIDAKRKDLLRRCAFDSLTLVDRVDGFTKVKNELIVLGGISVDAGIEAGDQSINKARTLRHFIRTERLPCLAVYLDANHGANEYLQSIITAQSRWDKTDRPERPIALDDLDAAQLNRVIITLSARIQSKRVAAGDTVHDMHWKAQVHDPKCKQCVQAAAAVRVLQAPRPAPELVESNNPF